MSSDQTSTQRDASRLNQIGVINRREIEARVL